jgi:hypothetical protein
MRRILWIGLICFACGAALLMLADVAHAGTILKLNLGGDSSADINFDGSNLSTLDDANAGGINNPGDQDTAVDFLDILSPLTDLPSPQASFNLHGLTAAGPATTTNGIVIQNFVGGTFQLYGPGPSFDLLLQGVLTNSALAGSQGPPGTAALFTTGIASVTGGIYAPVLDPNNLTLSMAMTNVNGGSGLHVGGDVAQFLLPFSADATLNIADTGPGIKGPEPTSFVLALIGGACAAVWSRRRRG